MKDKKSVNKRPIKTWKKVVLFIIAQVLLMASVLVAYNVLIDGRLIIETPYGYHSYYMDAFESEENFEDTYIFETMLRETLDNICVYSVISNQMETDGVFDGKKVINVSEYANRKSDSTDNGATAEFYLEDLLKWSKYGTEHNQCRVRIDNYNNPNNSTEYIVEEHDDIVTVDIIGEVEPGYSFPNQSVSGNDAANGDGFYNPEIWMKQSIDYYTPFANFFDVYGDEDGRVYGNIELLECRYKTVDGKNIEELVDNWQDYFTLVHNLHVAMTNLAINYESYQTFSLQYGEGKSNIKFCFLMTFNGEENYISNVEAFNGGRQSENSITEYFTNDKNKYLYYSPSDMEYLTNTNVSEDSIFYLLTDQYVAYAYPETTKVWIAVDTEYPVEDMFAQAHSQFENAVHIPVKYLGVTAVLLVIYIIMMIYLCCKAGWVKNEDNESVIRLNGFDRLHTEFSVIFAAISIILVCAMWALILDGYDAIDSLTYNGIRWGANIIIGVGVLISGSVIGAFWFSFVRRIKGHNLWSDTLIMAIVEGIKEKWTESVYANRNRMVHNWLIYLAYLVVNIIMGFLAFAFLFNSHVEIIGVLLFIIIFLFDIWVGYVLMRNINERFHIINGINRIRDGEISYKVTETMHGENQILANAVNNIGDGIRKAVETSMKDERMKADLITNVSHDIKTPLTSIINYVDLLKREDIQDEKVKGYIEILDSKSQRLKQLTEDLVEASKISSGNISYVFERINITELINQAIGEFSEKFESKGLTVVDNLAGQSAFIEADSRRMWRVVENLFNNVYKYALPNTRVYLTMVQETVGAVESVSLSVKNISAQPLNIDASELTERFIRGDVSRSTEGSGLGLSIAKNLTEAQHGKFDIYLDGDLFKVTLTFPVM